jgi:hypothetical protein
MLARGICFSLFLMILFISEASAQELKLDQVLSKHRESIGAVEKRKELKNMMVLGFSEFESKLPERKSVGKLAIVSNPSNMLFISSFLAESYPFEKIGLFEGKINIPFVNTGMRSPLGDFVFERPSLLQNGLFSGSMSLTWSILEDNFKKSKFKLDGTKKVDGRKAYVVDCFTAGTSDEFKIRLFLDAETFQHIRSEYREQFSGKAPTFPGTKPTTSETFGQINGYLIELTETFGEFKTFDGITLPTVYKVRYMGSSSKGTYEYEWVFKVGEVKFNQTLKEGFFAFN